MECTNRQIKGQKDIYWSPRFGIAKLKVKKSSIFLLALAWSSRPTLLWIELRAKVPSFQDYSGLTLSCTRALELKKPYIDFTFINFGKNKKLVLSYCFLKNWHFFQKYVHTIEGASTSSACVITKMYCIVFSFWALRLALNVLRIVRSSLIFEPL